MADSRYSVVYRTPSVRYSVSYTGRTYMELPDYPWLTWDEMVALRNDLVQHGLPEDPTDVRVRLAEAVANAESLRILFAGQWDEASRKFAWDLADEYRAAALWRKQATHQTSSRRH